VYLFYIYQICNIYFFNIRANEICKSKGKSKITVKDVMEAIEKAGLNNFKSEIDDLLLDIEREAISNSNKKSAKKENKNEINKNNEIKNNINNLPLNLDIDIEDIPPEKTLIKDDKI